MDNALLHLQYPSSTSQTNYTQTLRSLKVNGMSSVPPPPGIYVPAVLFFNEKEELDEAAITAHILRLAQVRRVFS